MEDDVRGAEDVPDDPFPPLTDIDADAAWLWEWYDSLVQAGFTVEQAFALTRDHLRLAFYGGPGG